MELKEIRDFVSEILQAISDSKHGCTYRNYENFVSGAGNRTLGNRATLKKFDYQFKKHGLTLHCGREERVSIFDFDKGDKVTFRRNKNTQSSTADKIGNRVIDYKHAGTINIANEESGITLFKHQEDAIAYIPLVMGWILLDLVRHGNGGERDDCCDAATIVAAARGAASVHDAQA